MNTVETIETKEYEHEKEGRLLDFSLDIHVGRALIEFSNRYPRLEEVVLELIQNGIDEKANKIEVRLNQKTRRLTVRDNGNGASPEQCREAFRTVLVSSKTSEDLGQFGIGLVSPLGKCEFYTFTSCPKPKTNAYKQWKFVKEDIAKSPNSTNIPMKDKPSYCLVEDNFGMRGKVHRVWWRSEVHVHNFSRDQHIASVDIDALAEKIQNRFSQAMEVKDVTVELRLINRQGEEEEMDVKSRRFSGTKLKTYTFHDKDAGVVKFRLYANRKRSKKHQVLLKEQDNKFRFEPGYFFGVLKRKDLIKDRTVLHLLDGANSPNGGLFQGVISVEKAELNSNRNTFKLNSAAFGIARAIEAWYEDVGEAFVQKRQDTERRKRFQECGLRVQNWLKTLLSEKKLSSLEDLMKEMEMGRIGREHADIPDDLLDGDDDDKSLSSDHLPNNHKKKEEEDDSDDENEDQDPPEDDKDDSQEEHEEHKPFNVTGPKGQKRKRVYNNSIGLQLEQRELPGESWPYRFEKELGVILFNTRHPHWAKVEHDDKKIDDLMIYFIIQAIHFEQTKMAGNDEDADAVQFYIEEATETFVNLLVMR